MLKKIISGAQTGADRAGLEAALTLGLAVGGTVPLGKKTDAGPLPDYEMQIYHLRENSSPYYPARTLANVRNSNGTVLFGNMESPGCRLTMKYCREQKRPYEINPTAEELRRFVEFYRIETLNVAGNRERTNPGIFRRVHALLVEAFGEDSHK